MREVIDEVIVKFKAVQQKFLAAEDANTPVDRKVLLYKVTIEDYRTLFALVAAHDEAMQTKEYESMATDIELQCIINSAACHTRLEQWADAIRFTNMLLDNKQRRKYRALTSQQIFLSKYLKALSMLHLQKNGSRNYIPSVIVEINDMSSIIAESSCESRIIANWKRKYKELVQMLAHYKQHGTFANTTTTTTTATTSIGTQEATKPSSYTLLHDGKFKEAIALHKAKNFAILSHESTTTSVIGMGMSKYDYLTQAHKDSMHSNSNSNSSSNSKNTQVQQQHDRDEATYSLIERAKAYTAVGEHVDAANAYLDW